MIWVGIGKVDNKIGFGKFFRVGVGWFDSIFVKVNEGFFLESNNFCHLTYILITFLIPFQFTAFFLFILRIFLCYINFPLFFFKLLLFIGCVLGQYYKNKTNKWADYSGQSEYSY